MIKNKKPLIILFSVSIISLLVFFNPFNSIDRMFMDKLYQKPVVTNHKIKIIGIDGKTLKEFGTFGTWSRDIYAKLITNITKNATPAVIGFDITFKSNMNQLADESFANAASQHNVVIANSVIFDKQVTIQDDFLHVNPLSVSKIEETYDQLEKVTSQGFSNACLDEDGLVRKSLLYVTKDNYIYNNFAYEVANQYMQKKNMTLNLPILDDYHRFGIKYSGMAGDYEKISFSDVINEKVDSRIFDDCIVLIGAYASGMQDSYYTPIEPNEKMYGVEIQANVVESLLSNRYYTEVPFALIVIYTIVFYGLFVFIIMNMSLLQSIFTSIIFIVFHLIFSKLLFYFSFEMPIINLILAIICTCILYIIISYFMQKIKSRHIENVLRKYVAPQVVDEVMKKGEFNLQPGGCMKDIAVLFVDIRGFTSLSETVDPTVVVEILNKYLSFTTNAIFNNRGTLDKFIGDATMAVFNSPVDLKDYEYYAIKTALDIAHGSEEINRFTNKRFNVSVGFGVGVHCGKAVVGNIGSLFRMDYTAIGDTVNTASRLEGKAKAGQILVSKEMYNRLKDRVVFSYVGEMELKGKKNKMEVYEVVRLKERGD